MLSLDAGAIRPLRDIGGAITKKRLAVAHDDVAGRPGELELLYSIMLAVLSSGPMDERLADSLRILVEGLGADAGEIWLYEPESEVVRLAVLHGTDQSFLERQKFAVGEGLTGLAWSTRAPVDADITADARFLRRSVVDAGFRVYRAVPMLSDPPPGVLSIAYRNPRALDQESRSLLSSVANTLGLVIHNEVLRDERAGARAVLDGLATRDAVARELQEHVLQTLFASTLALHAASTGDDLDRPAFNKAVDDLQAIIRDVRSLIVQLEQEPTLFLSARGLRNRIESLLAGTTAPTWELDFDLGEQRIDPRIEVELYLLVRELVANVHHHSHAAHASVLLHWDGDMLTLRVSDDGIGFDPDEVRARAMGLLNVEWRSQQLGGTLVIESAAGAGARVSCTLSLA